MKNCCICQVEKPVSEFNKNKTRKDGLNTLCKQCSQERSKRYYKENTELHKKNINRRKRIYLHRAKNIVNEFRRNGCSFCDEKCSVCIDAHHTKDKEHSIANMVRKGYSVNNIKKELSKCVPLCSNCHRKLHAGLISSENTNRTCANFGQSQVTIPA